MSYFTRMMPRKPTLAQKIDDLKDYFLNPLDKCVEKQRIYKDDDIIKDAFGCIRHRSAVEKKAQDEFAEHHLRMRF